MNYETFKGLPIGTVFMYDEKGSTAVKTIEVKINGNHCLIVQDLDSEWGDITGDIDKYDKTTFYYLLQLELAPKWIQKLYEVD